MNYSKNGTEQSPLLNLEHQAVNKSETEDFVAFECLKLTFDIYNETEDFIRIVEVCTYKNISTFYVQKRQFKLHPFWQKQGMHAEGVQYYCP